MKGATMLKNVAAIFAFCFVFFSPNLLAADTHDSKVTSSRIRVVVQVSDDDAKKWNLALNNVQNLQQELGASNADIEVVAYGPGINMLKFESVVADRIDEAIKAGVVIMACENSMKAFKLSKSDMITSIGYVPSGVLEIIKKQNAGYAYIRP